MAERSHVRDLFDLSGQVALVTGGSRGLGLEMAEGLGEAGAAVVITGRRQSYLDAAVAELQKAGITCHAVSADVGDALAAAQLVADAVARFGRLDILVNNAGVSWGAPALEMPLEQWRRVLETNATGAFIMAQAAARVMAAAGGGRIINIASVSGLLGSDPRIMRSVGYSASKGALISLTRALAAEWAEHGITVNAIAPGFFPTRMTQGVLAQAGDHIAARAPLGRAGRPGELKGVAVFLAAPAASYMTGQVVVVDGGATIW